MSSTSECDSPAIASSAISSLGSRRHGARQLELAHLDLREVAREPARLGVEPDLAQQLDAALVELGGRADQQGAPPHRVEQRDAQVVHHGEADERARQLEAARQPERACAGAPAGRRAPGRRTAPCRSRCAACRTMQLTSVLLPDPFGPIRPRRSPGCTSRSTALERDEAAEALADTPHLEQRRRSWLLSRAAPVDRRDR